MVTEKDLRDFGFEPFTNDEFDMWTHKEKPDIRVKKFSEVGYIIESDFIMSPVKTKQKLEIIINILLEED